MLLGRPYSGGFSLYFKHGDNSSPLRHHGYKGLPSKETHNDRSCEAALGENQCENQATSTINELLFLSKIRWITNSTQNNNLEKVVNLPFGGHQILESRSIALEWPKMVKYLPKKDRWVRCLPVLEWATWLAGPSQMDNGKPMVNIAINTRDWHYCF